MKKDHKLNDKFNPKDFEDRIYEDWEEKGYFKPSEDRTKETGINKYWNEYLIRCSLMIYTYNIWTVIPVVC